MVVFFQSLGKAHQDSGQSRSSSSSIRSDSWTQEATRCGVDPVLQHLLRQVEDHRRPRHGNECYAQTVRDSQRIDMGYV